MRLSSINLRKGFIWAGFGILLLASGRAWHSHSNGAGARPTRMRGISAVVAIPVSNWTPAHRHALEDLANLSELRQVTLVTWGYNVNETNYNIPGVQLTIFDEEDVTLGEALSVGAETAGSDDLVFIFPVCSPSGGDPQLKLPPIASSVILPYSVIEEAGGIDKRVRSSLYMREYLYGLCAGTVCNLVPWAKLLRVDESLQYCDPFTDRWDNRQLSEFLAYKRDEFLAQNSLHAGLKLWRQKHPCRTSQASPIFNRCKPHRHHGEVPRQTEVQEAHELAARNALMDILPGGASKGFVDELVDFNAVVDELVLHLSHGHLYFVLEPQLGLGNRMRAMASALMLAQRSKRRLRIVWEENEHCEAGYLDLFDVPPNVEIASHLNRKAFVAASGNFISYDYMRKDKGVWIKDPRDKHIHVTSPYRLISPAMIPWKEYEPSFTKIYRQFIPNILVQDIVLSIFPDWEYPEEGGNWNVLPNFVGAHIRSLSSSGGKDIQGTHGEAYTAEALMSIELNRASCHPVHFARAMLAIRRTTPGTAIFVAADDVDVVTYLTGE